MRDQQQSLADRAYITVEEMVITLALEPGRVFSETELSQDIGIGRTPLREALLRLISDGLIESIPRRGMRVAEIRLSDMMAVLETRRPLDRLIASRSARRASAEERSRIREVANAMRQDALDGNIDGFMRHDRGMDDLLCAAARNSFAANACSSLHAHCRRFWYAYKSVGDLSASASLHVELAEAIDRQDETGAAEASDKILDYLDVFAQSPLESYR